MNPSSGNLRRVCLTLALLALALKVLVPPGFMVSQAGDLPFELVVCTSQGAVTIDSSEALANRADHDKAPVGKAPHDAPCAFAGHAAAAPGPKLLDATVVSFAAYRIEPAFRTSDPAPGRGLAAPPLPARGPPSLLT